MLDDAITAAVVGTLSPIDASDGYEGFEWQEFQTPEKLVEHISNVPDIYEKIVEIPEWRAKILVKGLAASERNSILQNAMKGQADGVPNMVLVYPDLIIASCYHPQTGKKLFTQAHRGMLNSKSGAALDRITNVINELSAFGQTGQESARKNL